MGLYRAAELEGEMIEVSFPFIFGYAAFVHQAQQVPVCADVVKTVIMNSEMAEMRRHEPNCTGPPELEKLQRAGCIVLQNRRAVLKALRPLRPPPRRVFASHREDGRAFGKIPAPLDETDLFSRQLPEMLQLLLEAGGTQFVIDLHLWTQ